MVYVIFIKYILMYVCTNVFTHKCICMHYRSLIYFLAAVLEVITYP